MADNPKVTSDKEPFIPPLPKTCSGPKVSVWADSPTSNSIINQSEEQQTSQTGFLSQVSLINRQTGRNKKLEGINIYKQIS